MKSNFVKHLERRDFLRTGTGAAAGLMMSKSMMAAAPSLSIAKYKSSPTEDDGIAEEARRLTRAAIDGLGGMSRFVSKGQSVWVKPNIGWDRAPQQAACTNPDVVATVIEMCFEAGAGKVMVSDNPCNQAVRTFPRSGIQDAAKTAGADVFFLDQRKFRNMAINGKVIKEWEVYQDIVECDRLINVPIVKHHSLSTVTAGLKNLIGAVGGSRDRLHQNLGDTLSDLNEFIKPDLVVIDAVRVLTANGPVGGNLADVKRQDTVAAGTDLAGIDAFAVTLLGHKPEEIEHVAKAAERGLGTLDFESLSPKRTEV